ncbi:hypothetical protein RUM44_013711 [Polyplax serrata]|uniref:Uncharacterized protein n=1 Tax=Polyplax serrata TaxID=468196 RepID=A0ABR1BEX5_POLSC
MCLKKSLDPSTPRVQGNLNGLKRVKTASYYLKDVTSPKDVAKRRTYRDEENEDFQKSREGREDTCESTERARGHSEEGCPGLKERAGSCCLGAKKIEMRE